MVLDDRQQELFREALEKQGQDLAKLEGQLRAALTELVKTTLGENYDEKAVREGAEAVARIQVEMLSRRSQALAVVAPTLSPEQREDLLRGRAGPMLLASGLMDLRGRGLEREGVGKEPSRAPQPPFDPVRESLFSPELLMRFHAQIGLTAEQGRAIKHDLQEAQQKSEKLHEQLEREKGALASLLKKDRVELEPALAQMDKLLDAERELRRLELAVQIGVKNHLTPEQQVSLQELKRQEAPGSAVGAGLPIAIQAKLEQLQAGMKRWQRDGRDPSAIEQAMRKFKVLTQGGQFEDAEAVLDNALGMLEGKRPR
jgi:Spy/CpxP family protein refolding chaperone